MTPNQYYEARSKELGFNFTEKHARIEALVERLQQRCGVIPQKSSPKLTLIKGGRDDSR